MTLGERVRHAWNRFFFEAPTSIENLGFARIGIGLGLIVLHISNFYTLLGVDLDGPRFHFIDPVWYFELLGVDEMVPWLNVASFAVLMLATLGVIVGYQTRLSIAVVIACVFYLQGVRDSAAGDEHHRYHMWIHTLVFLAVSRAGEVRGFDGRRSTRSVEPWEATWPLRAAQLYVAGFYFVSAVAKLRVSGLDWVIDGTAVQKMLLLKESRWGLEGHSLGRALADHPTLCWLSVLATLVVELGFPILLFVRSERVRAVFLLGLTGFHIANAVLAGVNFWVTPVLFIVFFDLGRFAARAPSTARVTIS